MIQQGFDIGDNKWEVRCIYDVTTEKDLEEVRKSLFSLGCQEMAVQKALSILSIPNSGYTFTSFYKQATLIVISHTTSAEQMYDTIQHELKHATEHISEYYNVDSKSEDAAYLQGEIARQMFPAAAMLVCPKCNTNQLRRNIWR